MEDKNKLQEEIMKADNKTVEKIWKSIDEDHTLRAFLEKMTKDELVKIAKKYAVRGITTLKKADVVEKMVTGRVNKYYKEVCLVDQPFIKDGDLSVAKLLQSKSAEVIRFSRFQLGEGIEKKQDNLAEEVAKQINQ